MYPSHDPEGCRTNPFRMSLQHFPVLWFVGKSVLRFEGSVGRGFETSPCHRIVSVGWQLYSASYLYSWVCQCVEVAYRWDDNVMDQHSIQRDVTRSSNFSRDCNRDKLRSYLPEFCRGCTMRNRIRMDE